MTIHNTIAENYWPGETWRAVIPENAGIDPEFFAALDDEIKKKHRKINAFIVVRKGRLVFEKYYNRGEEKQPRHVASITKSVISALVGIAIDRGHIKDINQKALDFFPKYPCRPNDIKKKAITIKHLLTMTAPIGSKTIGKKWEPLDRLRRQKNWGEYILDILGKGQPGKFQYSTAGAHLLSIILSKAVGCSVREFANKHLFQPIGISSVPDHEMKSFQLEDVFGANMSGWIKDPQGHNTGGWGLHLTPRDLARFGLLYLNKGCWDNRQIISKKWIEESTAMNTNEYGYLWWLFETEQKPAFTAAGSGGNHIFCVPHRDLTVVITAEVSPKARERQPLLEKFVLPAIKN